MEAILKKWDIDPRQLWVLFRMSLTLDFRTIGTRYHQMEAKSSKYIFFATLFSYAMMSLFFSFLLMRVEDLYTYFYFIVTYTMVMTSMAVMIEFYAVVIHPDDQDVLGHRPISSSTYFVSKILNLTLYISLLTLSLCTLPILATVFWVKFKILLFPVLLIVFIAAGLTGAFLIIYLYTYLMTKIAFGKLQTILGYLQMILSLAIFGGYQFVGIMAGGNIQQTKISITDMHYLWLTPMSWYAGLADLIYGNTEPITLYLSGVAILFTFLLGYLGIKRISKTYAVAINAQKTEVNAELTAREKRAWTFQLANIFKDTDTRVGFTLVSLYLKRDRKLRMSIIPMFGMLVFYYIFGSMSRGQYHGFADIFTADSLWNIFQGGNIMFYMLVPFFISQTISAIRYNEDWKASWIYYTTPLNPNRMYRGAFIALHIWIYIPMWLVTMILFAYQMPVVHAIYQTIVIFIIAEYYGSIMHLLYCDLPLSAPMLMQGRQGKVMISLYAGMVISISLVIVEYFVVKWVITAILFLLGLVGVLLLLWYLENKRISNSYKKYEFVETSG